MSFDAKNIVHFALLNMILLAIETGEISEGQAVAMTGYNRVTLRKFHDEAIEVVKEQWKKYRFANPPKA